MPKVLITDIDKLDKADIDKLDPIDRERLSKVLKIVKTIKDKPVQKIIIDKTGEDRGNVSAYLRGKKAISTNFFTIFLDKFRSGQDEGLREGVAIQNNPGNQTTSGDDKSVYNNYIYKAIQSNIENSKKSQDNERLALENNAKALENHSQTNALIEKLAQNNVELINKLESTVNDLNEILKAAEAKIFVLQEELIQQGIQMNRYKDEGEARDKLHKSISESVLKNVKDRTPETADK